MKKEFDIPQEVIEMLEKMSASAKTTPDDILCVCIMGGFRGYINSLVLRSHE